MAQLASVLAWGASGRPFESDYPDKKYKGFRNESFSFLYLEYLSVRTILGSCGAFFLFSYSLSLIILLYSVEKKRKHKNQGCH
jgi:hypothetical protein